MDANAFLRRMLLVIAIAGLPFANVASAHGGHGSGGSGGGGGSSGGGHSAGTSGHSASATSASRSTTASKGSHVAADPVSVSQSRVDPTYNHIRVYRIFQQVPSTGYTTQYRDTSSDEWKRRHPHLLFGFIRY
ncbi:MAG: hypothetical protein WBZ19_17895 [Chthoniobacterales bacterium]